MPWRHRERTIAGVLTKRCQQPIFDEETPIVEIEREAHQESDILEIGYEVNEEDGNDTGRTAIDSIRKSQGRSDTVSNRSFGLELFDFPTGSRIDSGKP